MEGKSEAGQLKDGNFGRVTRRRTGQCMCLLSWKVKALVTQPCVTLCGLMDCSLPGSSVQGILQARMLEVD